MDSRENAKSLARAAADSGTPLSWFETLYDSAAGDAAAIPWAGLAPNPNFSEWLKSHPPGAGRRALVVGCGLGDDAEGLSRHGFDVIAFDLSPTAIQWCQRRFPDSTVRYVTADLLHLPGEWAGMFDLIVEAYTLQAMPAELMRKAVPLLPALLAPGGELLIICRGRSAGEPPGQLPFPLTKEDLEPLKAALTEKSFEDYLDASSENVRRFRCVYQKPERGGPGR